MTSKAALLNLLREKGDEQLGHIIQLADHKPHIYKKMLKAKDNVTISKEEKIIDMPKKHIQIEITKEEEPIKVKKGFFKKRK